MGAIEDAANLPGLQFGQTVPQWTEANAINVANDGINELAGQGEMSRQGQPPPFHEVTYKTNKDGTQDVYVKMPQSTLDRITPLIQTGQAAMDSFAQARQGLIAKAAFQEQHPLVSALGKIASTAAAGYASGPHDRISPIVRAAGAYGLDQFGQTPEQLYAQAGELGAKSFGIQDRITGAQQDEERFQMQERNRREALALENRRVKVEEANVAAKNIDRFLTPYQDAARNGQDVASAFLSDPATAQMTPQEKASQARSLTLLASAAQASQKRQKDLQFELSDREKRLQLTLAKQQEAARLGEAKALKILDDQRRDDQTIASYQQAQLEAESTFATMASGLKDEKGQPVPAPSNPREAAKVLSMAVQAEPDPAIKQKLLENGSKAIGALDQSKKIEGALKHREDIGKLLPESFKELGGRQAVDDLDVAFYNREHRLPTTEDRAKQRQALIEEAKRILPPPPPATGGAPGKGQQMFGEGDDPQAMQAQRDAVFNSIKGVLPKSFGRGAASARDAFMAVWDAVQGGDSKRGMPKTKAKIAATEQDIIDVIKALQGGVAAGTAAITGAAGTQ